MLFNKRHSEKEVQRIFAAYPFALRGDVKVVLKILPPQPEWWSKNNTYNHSVRMGAETLCIPYRIYSAEPENKEIEKLTSVQKTILATLYTRHANGFIREKWLAEIPADAAWQAPFVALLIGEYVAEIAESIYFTPQFNKEFFDKFVLDNNELCSLITARIISYWDRFYSGATTTFVDDPITGAPGYLKIKRPPILPLFDYSGYRAAKKCGIWSRRKPRKRRSGKAGFNFGEFIDELNELGIAASTVQVTTRQESAFRDARIHAVVPYLTIQIETQREYLQLGIDEREGNWGSVYPKTNEIRALWKSFVERSRLSLAELYDDEMFIFFRSIPELVVLKLVYENQEAVRQIIAHTVSVQAKYVFACSHPGFNIVFATKRDYLLASEQFESILQKTRKSIMTQVSVSLHDEATALISLKFFHCEMPDLNLSMLARQD